MKDRFVRLFVKQKNADARHSLGPRPAKLSGQGKEKKGMKLKEKIEELAATGYILLWLLGVPIPVLLLFFPLRGCT
jgi:hypothetical protein